MQLIEVIPISKSIGKETLSYFTALDLKEGDIVSVPLRKRTVPAIVISSKDAGAAKAEIRSSGFMVRKITARKSTTLFSNEFMKAVEDTAKYFASTTGAVLYSTVPKTILNSLDDIAQKKKIKVVEQTLKTQGVSGKNTKDTEKEKEKYKSEKFVLQEEENDRFVHYKILIREEFARNNSVFICSPTIADTEKIEAFLKKGIERRTFVFHSSLSKKEVVERWKKAVNEKNSILIIATGAFLSIPRDDIRTIIVERENGMAYKMLSRPFIDLRILAEFTAKHMRARFVLADMPLRIETMWKYKNREFNNLVPFKFKPAKKTKQMIIDMRQNNSLGKEKFEIIGNELKEIIGDVIKNKSRIFLFTARRGLFPTTLCRDCGNIVLCESCNAPVTVHKASSGQKNNIFMCHSCSTIRSANERCKNCASWRLEAFGIAIQAVEDVIKKYFPKSNVLRIDKDSTTTHKRARVVADKFYSEDGSILLGTEMALPYLSKAIEYSAIVSIDSMLFIPNWRIDQKIFSVALKINYLTKKVFIIQTRKPENKILEYAVKRNINDFYKDEIKRLEELKYPPFSTFIKIIITGSKIQTTKDTALLKNTLKAYDINIYPTLLHIKGNKYAVHGLLKIQSSQWPNIKLLNILHSLPQNFSIDVNPENLV